MHAVCTTASHEYSSGTETLTNHYQADNVIADSTFTSMPKVCYMGEGDGGNFFVALSTALMTAYICALSLDCFSFFVRDRLQFEEVLKTHMGV
mmetsp:Transcript_140455/g.244536  ORF Transcript_140455/g.244536 Transcript_140455/m.244536 type:complete len:93 (-) Transcript_140455:15-293(-)